MNPEAQVDGEVADLTAVSFSGIALIDRALLRDERVAFTLVGSVRAIKVQAKNGAVVRTHSVAVETVAEPGEDLIGDVTDLLQAVEDLREGRQQLPYDEDDEDGDE
jgi:hypothetical protein